MTSLVWKELLVLRKDLHGLLVLFVMPAIFILIMSLAMRDTFSERHGVEIYYLLLDSDQSEASLILREKLESVEGFRLVEEVTANNLGEVESLVATDRYKFAIFIPKGYGQRLEEQQRDGLLELLASPTVAPQLRRLFEVVLSASVHGSQFTQMMELLAEDDAPVADNDAMFASGLVKTRYVFQGEAPQVQPTSVQQSVPAWLVFSMFFVVIPLSTAFIIERQQGSMLRLRIMNISSLSLIVGKIIPYYLINQIQMVLMVLVGIYLVPQFGGDSLALNGSLLGLALISSATSLAAISFALLITTLATTHTQATTMGGVSNIIFGALGGVMVPKFVMPPFMRELADVSPMSWGLEGFLDIFLRNASWLEVLPEVGALLLFAMGSLTLAIFFFSRNN
ncbi:MAG: ABC transporter permease [Pseudomonadota bacterium]